ncbi:MAG: hypothetical protein Ta2A_23580 [Treponemataceae bacterium]|nr:MAG: hypothetical protein Ta2A_23580 [Treponemataceae bacterium]
MWVAIIRNLCHSYAVDTATIEQTITIPESREVRFTLPKTVPCGQAHITVAFAPKIQSIGQNEQQGNPLYGLAKKIGSKSTLELFLQQKNEDRALEIEIDERNGI